MIIVPNQYFGLGDVIFEQTIVRAFGEKILWPVEAQFVDGLNRAYPDITFINRKALNIDYERKGEYIQDGMKVLPLRWADSIMKVPYTDCMKSKYMLYGMHWQDWKINAMWTRNEEREGSIWNHLGIDQYNPYNLVNSTFGSESQLNLPISIDNSLPIVTMRTIQGFSLFDWAQVIERATCIHTVSTSIIYLLEQLTLEAKEIHIYPRRPIEQDLKCVDYLLTSHNYTLHA